MLHVGLDLCRTRVDVHVLNGAGETVEVTAVAPDAGGLRSLVDRLRCGRQPVSAVIESMNGARFVHDQLELAGWDVQIADAQKVKGLAPLACKTDRIDAWVLAELSRRDLVPAIWLPTPGVRAERERARWRLHLVRHRVALKNRVHSTLTAFGKPCPVSDLFGASGRALLGRLQVPEPWASHVLAAVAMIDDPRGVFQPLGRLSGVGVAAAWGPGAHWKWILTLCVPGGSRTVKPPPGLGVATSPKARPSTSNAVGPRSNTANATGRES
jgi:transposase